MDSLRKRIFLYIYRLAKFIYKILPIPIGIKRKLGQKVLSFLALIHPGAASNLAGYKHELCSYDIFTDQTASMDLQNILFPESVESAERIMIFLLPEHNVMSGGIYSMFSIATHAKQLKQYHGWEILVVTRPNKKFDLTYIRNRHFTNSIDVFRFSQILRLNNSKEIFFQMPEYEAEFFLDDISKEEKQFLMSRESVYINILNQNIKLMPPPDVISRLKSTFRRVGQSVAHHAYYGTEFLNKYKIDLMLLPAFTDLSNYLPLPLEKKEKLIIYSPDLAPHKKACIALLKSNFPDFKFVEISDITFDKYMEYASKCLFSITFGEGFDGYLAQPIYQGGIGFAIYNEEFFPSSDLLNFYNIFDCEETMLRELPSRMRRLLDDPQLYKSLNIKLHSMYDGLYCKEDYINRIEKLCRMEYEMLYCEPQHESDTGGSTFS